MPQLHGFGRSALESISTPRQQALRAMNNPANRRPRKLWRLATLAFLLTLTLGSGAQTSLHWPSPAPTGATAHATLAPARAATDNPAHGGMPLAGPFNVQQFEAMAQQLVANQRVPGLAMAIVHNGKVLSARGFGITDVREA